MKNYFAFLSVLLIFITNSYSQYDSLINHNDTNVYAVLFEKNIYHKWQNGQKDFDPGIDPNGPPHAQTGSGNFYFYFEDIGLGYNYGFNDLAEGPGRVSCVVAAFEYIESVILIPPLNDPIKIYIESSDASSFSGGQNDGLAWAALWYDTDWAGALETDPVSFSGGFLYEHITTGNTPTDPNYDFDGEMAFNLQNFTFSTNCDGTVPICSYDLFSVALHEATHLLGFVSAVIDDPFTPVPATNLVSSINANNENFPNRFTVFDQHFLFLLNGGIYTKLVDPVTGLAYFDQSDLVNNNFWLNDNQITINSRTNLPICSRNNYAAGTTLHHLDNSYRCRTYVSPQFVPDYIMCPAGRPEHHYLYTLHEIRILQEMGYQIQPSFDILINGLPQTRTIADLLNTPPYTTLPVINNNPNPNSDINTDYNYLQYTANLQSFFANISNDIGSFFIVDITTPAIYSFADNDFGNQISVYPGSLVNIRGCGIGGNNHACLTMPDEQHIIFTPRNNFVGRAQFGFNLYDGIEMGAFVVITVDVTHGNAVNTGSNELVLNGTVEEGTEVKILNDENKPENVQGYLGSYFKFPDCTNYFDIYLIRDNYRDCFSTSICQVNPNTVIMYGFSNSLVFGTSYLCGEAMPVSPLNNRYLHAYLNTYSFFLSEPLQCGNVYTLSIDMAIDGLPISQTATPDFDLNYGFSNNINTTILTETVFFDQTTQNYDTWLTFSTSFVYNGLPNNNVLSFRLIPQPINEFPDSYLFDNISLQLTGVIPATVDAGPDVNICPGQTTTLTATPGFTSYIWSTGNNTASLNVSPVATTTYSVTATNACGNTSTDDVTVYVMEPEPPVISQIPGICNFEEFDFMPYVSPSGGTFSGICTTPEGIFNASCAGTGIFNITYTAVDNNGCLASASFSITVIDDCCTGIYTIPSSGILASQIPAGTFSGIQVAVNGNLIVDTYLNINNCTLQFAPNVSIIINSGVPLEIANSNLYTCSNKMWKGIEITPGGHLTLVNSIIEDAKVGVLSNNTGNTASFKIEYSTFNRNYIGLKVINHSAGFIHPGRIIGTTFNSQPSVTNTNNTALLDNPYSYQIAEYGIELNKVDKIQIGDESDPLFNNTFLYLRTGIRATNSDYFVYNNEFRNNYQPPICDGSKGLCPVCGWAIWNTSTKCIVGGSQPGQKNTFRNLSSGILHENGKDINVIKNTFTNIINVNGATSITIHTVNQISGLVNIRDNDIKDVKTGIYHFNNSYVDFKLYNNLFRNFSSYGISAVQNTNGKISIASNNFNQNVSSAFTGNFAIYVANAVLPLTSSPQVDISDNAIYKINKGIYFIKIYKSVIKNNIVGFKNSIVPLTPNYYFGIRTQDCMGEYIFQNYIYKNGPVPNSQYENSVYGISVETNTDNASVLENTIQKLGKGLRFRGYNNANSKVRCNIMTQNWAGLTVDAVNIGQQGQPISLSFPLGDASDNQWSTIPSNMTGSVSVRGVNSPTPSDFYTRNAAYPWCPSPSNIQPVLSIHTASNWGLPLVPSAPQNCTNICYSPPCNLTLRARIAQNQTPFNLVTGNSRFLMQQDLLKTILADSTIDTSTMADGLILKYYRDTTLANTNMGIIATVSSKYAGGDTLGAEALNLAIDPKICAEMYHKIVNKIFFSTWARNIFYFSPSDSLILHDIAIQDPLICGTAIYDARVMMGIDVNDFSVDNNNKSANINSDDNTVTYNIGQLYPNPSQNIVFYETQLNDNESGILLIYDAIGNQVMAQQLNACYNKLNIDVSKLTNGLYLYRLCINGEFKEKNKFIIQR